MTTSGPAVLDDTVEYFYPFDGVTADDLLAWIRTRRHATDRSRLPDAQATAMQVAWETVMAAVGPADWRSWLVDDLDTYALAAAHVSAATDHEAATTDHEAATTAEHDLGLSVVFYQYWAEGHAVCLDEPKARRLH